MNLLKVKITVVYVKKRSTTKDMIATMDRVFISVYLDYNSGFAHRATKMVHISLSTIRRMDGKKSLYRNCGQVSAQSVK